MKKVCRKSGKRKYDTHERALTEAGNMLERTNQKIILRSYVCQHCGKWHLTSKAHK